MNVIINSYDIIIRSIIITLLDILNRGQVKILLINYRNIP